ncbi:MAG: hypothetical protein WBD99_02595 [Thermodesulfobacteriota bacterium]
MKEIKQKLLERIDDLLKKADRVQATHKPNPPNVIGFPTLDEDAFLEWKTNTEQLIVLATGENSIYHKNFVNEVKKGHTSHVDFGIGILRALKEDINGGFLDSIKDLVIAEVFDDFLDIADHLLENGYKDPSASLVGAVLEDGLRKIGVKNNIQIRVGDDIASLNTKIADGNIYNRLVQKQVQAWKAIRDSADHGKFGEYKSEDVRDMLNGVRRFLTEHL